MAILGALAGLFCQVNASLIHVGWSFSAFKLATKYVSLPWFFQPATFSLNGARRSRLKESFWRKYRAIQGRIGAVENLPTLPNLLKALGGSGRKNGETMRKGQPKKIAYSGAPKGHRYMRDTLKKGPISLLEESGRNLQGPKCF